ncbi:restriction endonuclease subunit S [Burkholderia ambifaria]|uniref:restriction endonuclease subunit S n=1 Tax=Burkholderia ambifaria TaxID=152480 RepID=UPI00158AF62E|nr:restriction endonuclease subunit S [Burkholderia ambifaria]
MSAVGKPGYQETAVGWIPRGWSASTLGAEVASIVGGGTPSKDIAGYWGGDIPWASVKDFVGCRLRKTQDYITRRAVKESATNLVPAGTLITPTRMALGRVAFFDCDVAINQDLKAIFPKPSLRKEFLFYWFQDNAERIEAAGTGSTVKGIRLEVLRDFLLALPPLAEQSKIAAILTAVDDKLDVIARQIEVTQTLKRGLMQTLFSRKVGGGSDEDWLVVPLREVAEVRTGVAKGKKGLKVPVELPYLRVANVQDGHIDLSEVKTIAVEASQVERYALRSGDVLMTEGGDFDKLGRGDVWEGKIFPCLHQNHVFAVRPDPKKLNSYFLAALAASDYGKQYFLSCAKRTTNLASINSSQLKAFPVLLPPLEIQKEISEVVDAANDKVAVLESRQAALQNLKRGLMRKLLTGEWRVQLEAAEAVAA